MLTGFSLAFVLFRSPFTWESAIFLITWAIRIPSVRAVQFIKILWDWINRKLHSANRPLVVGWDSATVSSLAILSPCDVSSTDGVILIDPDYVQNQKVYAHVLAAFRYGREDLDVLGLTFRKDLYLASAQVCIYWWKSLQKHTEIISVMAKDLYLASAQIYTIQRIIKESLYKNTPKSFQ